MQIIPAIDIIGGRCVRLTGGDFTRRTDYPGRPAEFVQRYTSAGFSTVHCVDLDGAKSGAVVNWDTITAVCAVPGAVLQVGGGVRSRSDVERLLDAGVHRVVIGSVAVTTPGLIAEWIRIFGPERLCIALDCREGQIAVSGWQESLPLTIDDVMPGFLASGVKWFLVTDIRRDGTLAGTDAGFYRRLSEQYPVARWIASGGVGSVGDIRTLRGTGISGVVVGKALLDGRIALDELAGER